MITEDEIKEISNKLGLPSYDVLLLGDGSGNSANGCSSWGCVRYIPVNNIVEVRFGGASLGTNNFAELMPYLSVLWLDTTEKHSVPRKIEIVSDSELSVKCGNREYKRNANLPLWAAFDCLEQLGYRIHWNHIPRNTNPANTLCDKLAGQVREEIEKIQLTSSQSSLIIR